jgi:hypothetical protein
MDEIPEDVDNDVYGGFIEIYDSESSKYFDSLAEANKYAARENFLQSKNPDSIRYYWVKDIE